MLTRCTHCSTWFRISDDDLLTSEGEVRCGSCNERFNAFDTLCDTGDDQTEDDDTADAAPSSEPDGDGARETVLREIVESQLFSTLTSGTVKTRKTTRTTPRKMAWLAGCIVLGLALLAQIVIYQRDVLRENPGTRNTIESLYNMVGKPLLPQTDIGKLTIAHAQVTGLPHSPQTLVLTATLTNHAAYPQTLPMLQITFADRFGDGIAQGIFSAADYLPTPKSTTSQLEAGQTRKIKLRIRDPGPQAVNFKIKPCLQGPTGLMCAFGKSG